MKEYISAGFRVLEGCGERGRHYENANRISAKCLRNGSSSKGKECYNDSMTGSATVAFVLDKELGIWTAHLPDVPAYGEGKTKEDALDDLKKAIALYIEEAGQEVFESHLSPATEYKKVSLRIFA